MNITAALADALSQDDYRRVSGENRKRGTHPKSGGAKPIVQLNKYPVTIDASRYQNARSTSNPNGDLRPLYALRQLVDPIPTFGKDYAPTASSTEAFYHSVIDGATALPSNTFSATVLQNAQKLFDLTSFDNMDGIPGTWRPVYAVPQDWASADDSRFKPMDLDVRRPGQSDNFGVIEDQDQRPDWVLEDGTRRQLNPATTISSVGLRYLLVGLQRPWFDATVFDVGGWYLGEEAAGFCSSGSPDKNKGILPLIPTGMLVGKEVSVNATWAKQDQDLIDKYKTSGKSLYLGPLKVTGKDVGTLQVIGFISELTPLSPRESKPKSGTITVENKGAFVCRYSVEYDTSNGPRTHKSGNFPVLVNREFDIPADATNIELKIEIMTFPKPIERWSTVQTAQFDRPQIVNFEVSGTTFDPKVKNKS